MKLFSTIIVKSTLPFQTKSVIIFLSMFYTFAYNMILETNAPWLPSYRYNHRTLNPNHQHHGRRRHHHHIHPPLDRNIGGVHKQMLQLPIHPPPSSSESCPELRPERRQQYLFRPSRFPFLLLAVPKNSLEMRS